MKSATDRIAAVIRDDVRAMHAYPIQDSTGLVKLDAMENPFRLPAALQAELGERLGRVAINRYPGACVGDVIAALSRHVGLPPGCKLMLGNGSDELIGLLATACAVPGATLLSPLPSFVMYEISARLQGLRFQSVALTDRFELDASAMLDAIETHRPAITYLAYPNNPTGNLFDEAAVERIVAAVGEQDGLLVFDEAYQPFSPRTWMSRVGSLPHVLVMRTLSKFGLAGVRLGYLAGPAALIEQIDKVRPPYSVGVLNAEATLFALDHADEFERQAALPARRAQEPDAQARSHGRRRAVPERRQHDPGPRCRQRGRLRGLEAKRRAGEERRCHASAAGPLPAPHCWHRRRERPDDRSIESHPRMKQPPRSRCSLPPKGARQCLRAAGRH